MKRIGILELISFVTGFCLMTFELAAARVLAPTIGSSTYVWTSVIGVIIAALSLGYYLGGIIADKRGYRHDVGWLLLLAALLVTGSLVLYAGTLHMISEWAIDTRLQAVAAALVLFAPASFVLGMVSPYLAKLNVRSLHTSGRSVASLSACNSVGGIAGTFITGFILFGYIGSRETIALVAVLLLAAGWLADRTHRRVLRSILCLLIILSGAVAFAVPAGDAISIDTASAHYEINDFFYNYAAVRGIRTGPSGIQSAVRLSGSKVPVFWYTTELAALTMQKQPKSVLVLGGGAFTLPEYLAMRLPNAQIDVVEIDPTLEKISRQYFYYEDKPNINLIFTDARTYINQTKKSYDVIIADVYGDGSIPFSLMTKEHGQMIAQRTNPDGIVLANIIGGLVGPCREVFDAVNNAYTQGLPHAFYTINPANGPERANMVALYSRTSNPYGLTPVRVSPAKAYTDNFAPAERLYYRCEAV